MATVILIADLLVFACVIFTLCKVWVSMSEIYTLFELLICYVVIGLLYVLSIYALYRAFVGLL